MPNTLAHIGLQIPVTRTLFRNADPLLIYLGCIIPDIPWILQRIARLAVPEEVIGLRYYFDVQASLIGSLVLCAAVALLTPSVKRVFTLLGLNVILHLLLDACQTRFANGVHFLAPYSWELSSWGLFWPETAVTYILTGLGIVLGVWTFARTRSEVSFSFDRLRRRLGMAAPFAALYVLLPLFLIEGPRRADNHFLVTLHGLEDRSGYYVEFDRAQTTLSTDRHLLYLADGDTIVVRNLAIKGDATVSLRGRFITNHEIVALEYHVHRSGARDVASIVGLLLISSAWLRRYGHAVCE